jgi:RHS repeat-associated protein
MQGEDNSPAKRRTLLRIHYKPLTLGYSFGSGITTSIRNATPDVIDSIYYPATGTGYWFNDTDSYSSYGMITKVIEQRGMSWSSSSEPQGTINSGQMTKKAIYNYPLTTANESGRTNGVGLTDAPTYTNLTESWDGRDVNEDAITTYALDNNTSFTDSYGTHPARLVTVTQPNGTISKQYSYRTPGAWMDGLIFTDQTIVMNGTTPTIVSSSSVSWQQGDYQSPRPSWAEITDENGNKVKTVYDYTNGLFNQVTRSCDYDNAGTKLRCATATYENSQNYKGTWNSVNTNNGVEWYYAGGRHIFNLLLSSTVENPDGTVASRTDYELDNYQAQLLVNTPGVIQFNESNNPYTTQTIQVQGECIQWEEHPYGGQYCVAWNYYDVSVFDPNTNYRGNVTKQTSYADAQNQTGAIAQTSQYDMTGNMVKASTSCCEQTAVQYGVSNYYAYPESQTRGSADQNSPDRITTSSVYNFQTGLLKQTTDANGRTSVTNYNPDSLRPIKSISSTGAYTQFAYDDTAMTVTEEVYGVDNSIEKLAGKTVKYLNGIGQVKREEALGENNVWDVVENKYNKIGESWKQSRPFRANETPIFSENIYDSQGRTKEVIETDGSSSKAFYNETQRPDSASNEIGNTVRVADAWGRERWGRYDQQGRLVEVVEPNPNGNGSVFATGSLKTTYQYDTLGRLIQTNQGDQVRKFKYDSLGRLTKQKLAEQTATLDNNGVYVGAGNSNAVWSESFVYDNRSNLIQKTDARNVKSNYSFIKPDGYEDALNRIRQVSYDTSGATNVLYAPPVTYSYMTTGDKARIQQIRTDGILTENYSYDVEGRVSDYTQTVDYRTSYPMTTSYLYDSLDRTKEVRYPAQYGISGSPRKIVEPTYDTASRLSSLKVDGQQQAGDIVYNSSDQTESIKIGLPGTNQVTESYTYDAQSGLLTNQKAIRNGTTLLDLSYDYARNNSVGNQNGKTGHLTKIIDNLNNSKNKEYEYDALGRLTKAKGGNNLWTQNYTYDRYGNRTNVTASGNGIDNAPMQTDGIPNLSYETASNRITTSGYEYDVAGNMTTGQDQSGVWLKYEYDAANRLQVIKKASDNSYVQAYQFGSTNARLMDMDYGYGYLKIFGNNGAVEYTEFAGAVPTWTKSYFYLSERLLSTVTPNGSGGEYTEYNHPDKLDTRLITSQSGVSEQTHLPFGTTLNSETTNITSTKKFTTYERSNRTGLDYAINRTYDSKLGRFTQVDPIGMKAVDLKVPQTLNLYNYCGNDPINRIDSLGLSWLSKLWKVIKLIVNIVKIIVAVTAIIAAIVIFGPFLGTLLAIAFTVVPNIVKMALQTIWTNIKQAVKETGLTFGSIFRGIGRGIKQAFGFVKAIFSRGINSLVPIYGYFCAPGWGIDGPTVNQQPTDELDSACKEHDTKMREIDDLYESGKISKREWKRLKTKADLRFMKKAMFSYNRATGGFLISLQIGFMFRILFR